MVSPFALTPFAAVMLSTMFALSDDQLALVMTAAGSVPVGKRGVFLERVAVRPQLRGPHFTDADLGAAIQVAVIQSAA
jgi:hypothetical protein